MDWKEFFKPTISKIIVFVMIFLFFVPFIDYDNGIRCIKAPCHSSDTGSVLMYLLFSYKPNMTIFSFSYICLIAGMIISYLISCAIAFGFNRLKKEV